MTFSPDGDVLSTTVQEPRFTLAEKNILLASRQRDARPRGSHGLLLSEAADPANQFAFEVPPPAADFAQAKLSAAQENYRKTYPNADMSALLWRVEKKSS